jgi:hypothetical protein
MEATGMEEAAAKIRKVEKATNKLKNKTKEASAATDANTNSTDKNTTSKEKNTNADKNNITSGFTRAIMLQTAASATNQFTGATYKMIAGLEANNLVDQERAMQLQENARRLELFTGGMEIMLSVQTVMTTMTEIDTAAKGKNAAATATQTKAQWGLNAAMMANPMGMAITIVLSLVAALVLLEMKFGSVTKAIDSTRKAIEKVTDAFATFRDMGDTDWGFGTGPSKQGTAEPSFMTESRKQGFGGRRMV